MNSFYLDGIHAGRRLVEQNEFRSHHESARNLDQTLLFMRKLAYAHIAQIGEANELKRLFRVPNQFQLLGAGARRTEKDACPPGLILGSGSH